jgi:hypothetical protein
VSYWRATTLPSLLFVGLVAGWGKPSECGAPRYSSRTDVATVQLPTPIPNVGNLKRANKPLVDPDFGNRILRVTDATTDPSRANFTNAAGIGGSADQNVWNSDSTMFITENTGGNYYLFSFNPSSMQAGRPYASHFASTGGMTLPTGTFAHKNPQLYYAFKGTRIEEYDFTNRSRPPTPKLLYDFTAAKSCLPSRYQVGWYAIAGSDATDNVFAEALSSNGGQGSGVDVVVYKAGNGCRHLNLANGLVTGEWGNSGTIPISDRFTVHNVKLSKDGNWLIIVSQKCLSSSCTGSGVYFWLIGTTTVNACPKFCSGHWTEGYTHWINNDTDAVQELLRPFSSPGSFTKTISSLPAGLTAPNDQHPSWNNADSSDSNAVLTTTYSVLSPFPAAWYNEVLGVGTDGSGKVWRFCHTFATAKSHRFSTEAAIGSGSQDGRFFMFSSDWMGTLGSENGSAVCRVGTDCRGDVFIVELK